MIDPSYGPVITSAIRLPCDQRRRGHYVEDAGYPHLLSWLAELGDARPHRARFAGDPHRAARLDRLVGSRADTDLGAELAEMIGEGVLSSRSMPLLSMGRDLP